MAAIQYLRRTTLHAAFAALALAGASGASAQQQSEWNSFISVSPVFEEADLDSGGDFNVGGAIVRFGASREIGGGNRAGITVNYDYFDYNFGNATAFGGAAPWNILQRYGFSVPLSFRMSDGWVVGVTPSFDWFLENGAKSSDALVWGATFTAAKRFDNGNVLGIGLAAFERLEETSFLPFLIVDWRLSERWRLINPLQAGPTGGAGLELDYVTDSGWNIGPGFAIRRARYRLSESGPTPNGIGDIRGVPIFLRASRTFAKMYTVNLYGGVVAGGELRVEDQNGNLLTKEDFKIGPLLGFNITARF
jgi:hypothetical protein